MSAWRERSLAYAVLRGWRSLHGRARFGEREYRLLPFLLRDGAAAIDIGANLGFYTFRMAGLVGRRGRVLAVEPLPELAMRLRRSAQVLGRSELVVENVACGRAAGRGTMAIPSGPSGRPDFGQAHLGEGSLAVEVTTVDLLVARHALARVDLIKLDAEGAESLILEGARGLLERDRPALICELQDLWASRYGGDAQTTLDLLCGTYGYTALAFVDERLCVVDKIRAEIMNYLFLPPG